MKNYFEPVKVLVFIVEAPSIAEQSPEAKKQSLEGAPTSETLEVKEPGM